MSAYVLIILLFSNEGWLVDTFDDYFTNRQFCEAVLELSRPGLDRAYEGKAQYWGRCLEVQSTERALSIIGRRE